MKHLLEVNNLSYAYHTLQGETLVLDHVNFSIEQGEFVAIVGPSGCGKSTLLSLICHLLEPDSGEIVLGDHKKTGYMLQKDHLLEWRTTYKNIALGPEIARQSSLDLSKKIDTMLTNYQLDGFRNAKPNQLSGGMRQRAALLRTYLAGDRVALLDEPFSALDTITKSAMHRWYLSVMEEIKLSTIFITHDIDEAVLLSDRILILSGRPGKITHQITIAEPKPRRRDFNLTPEFLDYKKQVIDALGVVL